MSIIWNYKNLIATLLSLVSMWDIALLADFSFANRSSRFRVNSGSELIVGSTLTGWNGTFDQQGTISGESIVFDDGILEVNGTLGLFKGKYDADASQQIILSGNQHLRLDSGVFDKRILVKNSGNRLEGQPLFTSDTKNTPNIELEDSSAVLTLGVQTSINSFIKLNGGTIILDSDFKFADNKTIVDSGTVNLNNHSFIHGGQDMHLTHTVVWQNATDKRLWANKTLTGMWTFGGSSANLNGNGNILDLSTTGTIKVNSGTNLYLSDIHIKGLGNGLGSFFLEDNTSRLTLSNVTLELEDNYGFTEGGIYVNGPTTIITKDKKFVFSLNGSLTVDGVVLEYDTLAYPYENNIVPANTSESEESLPKITFLNDGVVRGKLRLIRQTSSALLYGLRTNSNALLYGIRTNSAALMYGARTNSNALLYGARTNSNALLYGIRTNSTALKYGIRTNSSALMYGNRTNSHAILKIKCPGNLINPTLLPGDVYLHENPINCSRKIIVTEDTIMDGGNNTIRFANDDDLINIANGKTFTIQNTILKDFSPSHVYLNSSGNIIFGTGVHIQLAPNNTDLINDGIDLNYTWTFADGSMILDGMGHELNIETGIRNAISLQGTSTLSIENIKINGLGDTIGSSRIHNIKSVDRFSTICWRNAEVIMTNNYTYSNGYMSFFPDVLVKGAGHSFAYSSNKSGSIKSNAILTFDHGVTFSYDPVSDPSKTIFSLDSIDSSLFLCGATLYTTHTGLRFTQGNLFIDNKVTFTSEARNDAEAIEIKDDVNVKILAGAILDIQGRVRVIP